MQNQPRLFESDLHILVISVGDFDELDTPGFQVSDVPDDVVGEESNVLHTGAVVEVDVFFDLGFLFAVRGLVDGHFYDFVGRRHYDGFEGRVFAVFIVSLLCFG